MGTLRPVLVLVSGLQGTGKSTLAAGIANALGAEQTMLAAETLAAERSVVVESVMAPDFRDRLRSEAAALGAPCVVVECVCADIDLHRRRVESRFTAGDSVITWQRVLDEAKTYVPSRDPDYVADASVPVLAHVIAVTGLVRVARG